MKPCFAGLGILALAATPLAAIPIALPAAPVQAREDVAIPAATAASPARYEDAMPGQPLND